MLVHVHSNCNKRVGTQVKMLRIINMKDMHHCSFWVVLGIVCLRDGIVIFLLCSKNDFSCCFELVLYGMVVV